MRNLKTCVLNSLVTIFILSICYYSTLQLYLSNIPAKKRKREREKKENYCLLFVSSVQQGCALAEPGGPVAPNFCPRATRKSQIFHTNHTLGTLDFTDSEDWAPFNFPIRALKIIKISVTHPHAYCFLRLLSLSPTVCCLKNYMVTIKF